MHRELCLHGSLSHLDGAFLLDFLWPVILLFLKPESLPVYSFISQLRQIPTQRTVGKLTSQIMPWHPSFLAPKEPFLICIARKVSLISGMRNIWPLYLLSGQDSTPLYWSLSLSWVPVHRAQTSAWGPSISFLKKTDKQEKNKQKFINIHSSCTYGSTQ